MAARCINIDHDTPLLLPPDLRDWVPEDHLVHFIMDAVGLLDLRAAHGNHSGSGSEQFPPSLMLGLLIYSYATGTFSSRRIEKHTHEQVAVRWLCADTHPDHDTIGAFRRENRELLASSFHQVLETAARIRVLRVGEVTLALDGTKILAHASKHSAVSHGHATAQMQLLEAEIAPLLHKAEEADSTPLEDGLTVPAEVARRQQRIEKLRAATAAIEARAKERHREEMAALAGKQKRREEAQSAGRKPGGRAPQPPREGPRRKDQSNFTAPESRIMKSGSGFAQSDNAPAAVEVESRLLVSQAVTDAPNERGATRTHPRRHQPRDRKHLRRARGQRLFQRSRRERRRERARRAARPEGVCRDPTPAARAPSRGPRKARRPACARARSEHRDSDGPPAGDQSGARTLRPAQTNHRTGLRDHQSGPGF
jgi:transposase